MPRLSRPPVNLGGDTEGCPLLSMAIGPNGITAGMSRPSVALVKEVVHQAIAGGEVVIMEVANPWRRSLVRGVAGVHQYGCSTA